MPGGARVVMAGKIVAGAAAMPLAALVLAACVSQSAYDEQASQLKQAQAQIAAQQAEIANNIVPRLRGLQNAKIVVYGYTDNTPVGPELQRQGIPDNLVLSTRRAATVVTFLVSQGINPNIVSAKGFGDTHPVASNDTPQGRAANRRIEITVQGPGASGA